MQNKKTETLTGAIENAYSVSESKVRSLAKALKILECFSVEKPELGITDISKITGLYKSTVHNIISTFCDMGYVTFNPDNSKYFLGLRLLHFGYIINTHLGIRNIFLPFLQKIANTVEETTFLGIPDGKEVLYIESSSPHGGATRNILGERAPLYCTGLGKAMLAYLPDIESRIGKIEAFTNNTITDINKIYNELTRIKIQGYALDNMEHEYGVKCVAVPIFDHTGEIAAAISVSAPSLRMDDDSIPRISQIMIDILKPIQKVL